VLFGAAGEAEYLRVSLSTGKMPQVAPYSGAMLAMVARSARGEFGDAGAVELDELADDAVLAQGLGDSEDEVGGGGAFFSLPVRRKPTTWGRSMETGWRAWRLRPRCRQRPAEDAEAVDHGGVGVGADQGVGVGGDFAVEAGRGGEDDAGEVFEVDPGGRCPFRGERRRSC